ncbi:MAG: hypothetical protein C0473_01095 [Cyanobacteria bacterium DS3.002]|jgi:PAS domain S-box-containing protein|nr:hypothetical protein [Cyanobacteria bacterium DS3.002]
MKNSLRLSHKILLLVLVPVAVELIYLGMLMVLVDQLEVEFAKEVRGRKLVNVVNDIHTCIGKGSDAFIRYMQSRDPDEITAYENYLYQGGLNLASLERMLDAGNTKQQARVAKIKVLIGKAKVASTDLLHAIQGGNSHRLFLGVLGKKAADDVLRELNNINRDEQEELNHRRDAIELRRQHLKTALVSGAALNIIVAALAAIWIAGSLTRRIKRLVENSRRIGANVQLPEKLSGNDELAELDSALRRMARELAETMRKQRAMVEHATEVICSIDESCRFTEVSEAIESIWSYSPSDLIGRRLVSIIRADDQDRTLLAMNEAMQGSLITFENQVVKPNKTVADMSWSVRWVSEERAFFAVAHDISERKELERLKQEFVSIVSHDLRSPLSSLSLKLDLLASGVRGTLPEAALAEVAKAQANIQQLISLTGDLLDLERLETGKWHMHFRKRSLLGVLSDAVQSIQGICDLRNIEVLLPEQDVLIVVDGNRLVQVVINILSNSLKYAPEGQPIEIDFIQEGDFIKVIIADKGPGIPVEDQAAIFERFKQASQYTSKTPGFGLGLSICSQIIHAHGGTMGIESEPGHGCVFWFRIPKDQ